MKYCDACHNTYPTDFATCPKDQTVLRPITDLVSGMVLRGKYRVEEKIGEGGMATVYRASHLHFNEELAIKVVNNALSGNQDFLDRFKREAVITRKLRHPNAVRLDDFDITEDGRPFIAMEYVRGKSLRAVLQEKGNLPIPRAFNIARQVALALGAAHQLGIVHRDIKPDNVLLVPQPDGSDLVKVLDFGIAKATGEQLQSGPGYKPTSTGMVLGTPHYLSPEQARGKKSEQIDGRADLYALGVMLYEMVTGELPFKSDTAIEMLLHHIQTAPVPTNILKPEMNESAGERSRPTLPDRRTDGPGVERSGSCCQRSSWRPAAHSCWRHRGCFQYRRDGRSVGIASGGGDRCISRHDRCHRVCNRSTCLGNACPGKKLVDKKEALAAMVRGSHNGAGDFDLGSVAVGRTQQRGTTDK